MPSGPGSVGLLVAVPVSPPLSVFGLSAPREPSSTPWLADGFTPTLSEGLLASLLEVAPSVTTVPSTATSSAPAPAATRLRRARPLMPARCVLGGCPPDADRLTTIVAPSPVEGADGRAGGKPGRTAGTPPGGDWDSS